MLNHEEAWDAFRNSRPLGYQKAAIVREVKAVLGAAPGATFSTNDLVEAIYPPRLRHQSGGMSVVKRIYSLLRGLANKELSAFNVQGAPILRKRFGGDRVERPRVWRFAHTDECADMRAEAEEAGPSKPATLYALIAQAKDFADFQRLAREAQ